MDLVTIKNQLHTTLFLSVASICILCYETAIPLGLLWCAIRMLQILYDHETYTPIPPDVKRNIYFIQCLSEWVTAGKYNMD